MAALFSTCFLVVSSGFFFFSVAGGRRTGRVVGGRGGEWQRRGRCIVVRHATVHGAVHTGGEGGQEKEEQGRAEEQWWQPGRWL